MQMYVTTSLKWPVLLIVFLIGLSGCRTFQGFQSEYYDSPFPLMTGSFSSADQAAEDSTYFDISLHMYPIWEGRAGKWLYVEQAVSSQQDAPYRQRIYQLKPLGDDQFESVVYTIENEAVFVGKWKDPAFFEAYDTSILKEREGCSVFLKKVKQNTFIGSTRGEDCPSSLQGAVYATSEVQIEEGRIISWDRGFNEEGEQVWGATEGGYIFDRKEK